MTSVSQKFSFTLTMKKSIHLLLFFLKLVCSKTNKHQSRPRVTLSNNLTVVGVFDDGYEKVGDMYHSVKKWSKPHPYQIFFLGENFFLKKIFEKKVVHFLLKRRENVFLEK